MSARAYCEIPGCVKKNGQPKVSVGRDADGHLVCQGHKYEPCHVCGNVGGYLDPEGRSVCKGHKYEPCHVCGNVSSGLDPEGRSACTRHKYEPCHVCGNVGGLLDPEGRSVCGRHKYEPCHVCGNVGGYLDPEGRSLCKGHKYGTCHAEGCAASACGPGANGLGACERHYYGPCEVPGCAGFIWYEGTKLCRTHFDRGADHVITAGMQADKPGLIYVVYHPELDAIKIGIGVAGADRLRQHRSNGWDVVYTDETLTVADARAIERAVCSRWRIAGVPVGALAHRMPQGGHTETAPGSLEDARTLARWVREGDLSTEPPLPNMFVIPTDPTTRSTSKEQTA